MPPVTGILDDFNRANGAPGANWSTLIGTQAVPNITSNALLWSAASHSFRWNPSTFGPDCEVYADVPGNNASLWARVVAAPASGQPRTGYVCYLDANRTRVLLYKADGTGFTTIIGPVVTGLPTSDGLWMTCIGTQITVYTRASGTWTQRIQVTDTSFGAAGYIGGELLSSPASIDNFGGGTLGGGSALTLSLSDSTTPTEVLSRAQGFGLSLADSATPGEVLSRAQGHSLALSDLANAEDGTFGTSQGFAATILDNVVPTDLLLLAGGAQQSLVDSALVTDSLAINVVAPDTPCKPDAVCGIPICGAAICGAWWTCPTPVGIGLGATPPELLIEGDIVIPSGLALGATVPGLVIDQTLFPPPAGLAFGATAALVTSSSAVAINPAGLGLGAEPVQATLVWMLPIDCTDLELQPDSERELILVGAVSSDLDLDPEECL